MTPYAVVWNWSMTSARRRDLLDRVKLAGVCGARNPSTRRGGFAETHGCQAPPGFAADAAAGGAFPRRAAVRPFGRGRGYHFFPMTASPSAPTRSGQRARERKQLRRRPGDAAPETEGGGAFGDRRSRTGRKPDRRGRQPGAAVSEPATEASDASDAMPADQTAAQAGTEDARDEEEKAESSAPRTRT